MRMRRFSSDIEEAYLRFIARTRLGVVVLAGAAAFFVIVAWLGVHGFAVAYTVALFIPLVAVALWRRRDFIALGPGQTSWARSAVIGVVPMGVFVLIVCSLIYELHVSYHAPINRYVAPILQGIPKSQNWAVFEAPFVEEMIFRLWLQTRLQQYLGLAGAVLSCIVFLAVHLTISPWRVIVAIVLTGIRYRSGSLGATILAHYTYDVGIWAFATFVP